MSPVAVFVHLHYLDVWPGIRRRLEERLPTPFRLIVTTTSDHPSIEAPATPHMTDMVVRRVENRGRDVLPFLRALREAEPFEIGLKLHGKRSAHRLDGDAWRDKLLDTLLPTASDVRTTVARMRDDRRLVLVSPDDALCSIAMHMGSNLADMDRVARRLKFDLQGGMRRTPYFVAGTMFWFRRAALDPILTTDLETLFVPESGQTDGTVAHALERLFAVVAERDGGVTLPMNVVEASRPDLSREAFRELARSALDIDRTFVPMPSPLVAFASRRFRYPMAFYLMLPVPLRRVIKASVLRLSRS